MSSTTVLDPNGDILLQLVNKSLSDDTSDEKTVDRKLEIQEVVVSSKVLSLVSPVFTAMLNGQFKEGTELAQATASSQTYALSLPDDDVGATMLLCRILHFNITDIPDKPTPVCLEKLAYLCDKYQCTSVMKYCGGLWLRNWLLVCDSDVCSIDDLCRLLIFAYVIDLPREFSNISWKLFLYHKGPFTGQYTQVVTLLDHPLLHQDVVLTLNTKRFECCQSLHRGINAPINWDWYTISKGCYAGAKAVGRYYDSLRKAKIFPYDLEFTEHKFCDLIREAVKLPETSVSQYKCQTYSCECKKDPINELSGQIVKEVRGMNQLQKTFICLDCLKANGMSKDDKKCRISHA